MKIINIVTLKRGGLVSVENFIITEEKQKEDFAKAQNAFIAKIKALDSKIGEKREQFAIHYCYFNHSETEIYFNRSENF